MPPRIVLCQNEYCSLTGVWRVILSGTGAPRHFSIFEGEQMQIATVGVMSPGDMGQALAMQFKAEGLTVCTALDGRSARSHKLAQQAELIDVGTIARLVAECDVVLSVMNPGAAVDFAQAAAA